MIFVYLHAYWQIDSNCELNSIKHPPMFAKIVSFSTDLLSNDVKCN